MPADVNVAPRTLLGVALAVFAAGIVAALVQAPTDARQAAGDRDAAVDAELARLAALQDTTVTTAPRVDLDVTSNAPDGADMATLATLPQLDPIDGRSLAADSTPQTGGYTDLIRSYFGPITVEALVIAQCESGFVPWAVGTNTDGSRDHGLFQINDIHAAAFTSVTGQDWEVGRYDAVANTAFARWLYDIRGWESWTCRTRLADPN